MQFRIGEEIKGRVVAIDYLNNVITIGVNVKVKDATKPIVDWSAMPKWAKWVAMDKDGEWFWYCKYPVVQCDYWEYENDNEYGLIPPEYAPKYDGSWEDSLVERPEGE